MSSDDSHTKKSDKHHTNINAKKMYSRPPPLALQTLAFFFYHSRSTLLKPKFIVYRLTFFHRRLGVTDP